MNALRDTLLIDGATGSELDRRGVDTTLPLWSARALIDAPDVLEQIHREYLEAGAQAITANTFRTHRRSLAKAGLGDRARELTLRAVEIAKRARDSVDPDAIVMGSIAPLEDCYEPALAPDEASCRREHHEMIDHLCEAGVDLLLIETMNNLTETWAAIEAARHRLAGPWIVSFCTRGDVNRPGTLLSGERIATIISDLGDAYAIGVNCVAAPAAEVEVRHLRDHLPRSTRIIAYANIGAPDPVRGWANSDAVDPRKYAEYARCWVDAGATIIGGCCGTTPQTIGAISQMLDR